MAKYSKKLVGIISELLENDLSVTDICNSVGINRKTFYEWINTKPQFAQAVEEARDRAYDELITLARRTLRERIEGYTVEETTYTYEPSSYDNSEMILKKKVVKTKRREPSITSLNNLIQNAKTRKSDRNPSLEATNKIKKGGIITPRNSEEAMTLARFYQKIHQESQIQNE